MNNGMRQHVAILAARSTIGRALAERLHASNATVSLIGRDLSGVETAEGSRVECALTDFESVESALKEVRDSTGDLTGIVNCAGSMLLKPAHTCDRADYDATFEANLATAFAAVRSAPRAFSSDGGSVVLISSAAAALGMPNHELIGAAKGAVEGLVRSAAATYASRGIRFNAVAPGLVATNLSEKLMANETSRSVSESLHALRRTGSAGEIASAIAWLLHPEQSWVTGQVIGVDGGLSRVQPRPRIGAKA